MILRRRDTAEARAYWDHVEKVAHGVRVSRPAWVKELRMDSRYCDQGFAASLLQTKYGAFLTIRQHNVLIGEISLGFFTGDKDAELQIAITRVREDDLALVD